MQKSTFGSVRKLKSGRFQARFLEGGKHVSAGTFATAKEAWKALAAIQTDIDRGEHVEVEKGRLTFAEHAQNVLEHRRGDLRDSTVRNWQQSLRAQLLPTFGRMAVADITVGDVDRWWAAFKHKAPSRRNSYFVMANIMRYAVRWQIIKSSPCVIENAGRDVSTKRPDFTVDDFRAVVAHMPLFMGPALWTMFAAHLRVSEVCGINREDYDRATGILHVRRQYVSHGPRSLGPTKTGAVKKVRLLAPGRAALEAHLDSTEGQGWQAMFHGPRGHRMNPRSIQDAWEQAREAAGLPNFHVHDARHIGLTLVAQSGVASLRDLMARGGHTTASAAIRYLHSSAEQDAKVAAATDALL
ncbi:tyrosine-type recombinase/integrase [Curtobacterium sp. A7_M15]|uniref:tyrosine-type recombinase/integrase n=1 Tax=Curtobacterium sp. A7_M15 TaxID=3065241 RepID=UPI002737F18E|nr:site-specific integrase [Curtobacterium sp. A7_M15]MDP4333567.1 tyrosine-type recombinase/integrase [Curtobacterium sp. A7_M15]